MKKKTEIERDGFILAWWSAGITSAVACKIALELYDNVRIFYIKINSAHEDNERFKKDCEKWYGQKIEDIQSSKFKDQFEVIKATGAVNTPEGAPCTGVLKKDVRFQLEKKYSLALFNTEYITSQVWGYEFEKKQINRAIRHGMEYREHQQLFPLIEKGLDKDECAGILNSNGIALPVMYLLGFGNNNCIGCVKGGKGYWNLIRIHFPNIFSLMAKTEREVGYSCINGCFLDELDPNEGLKGKPVMPNCGIICDVALGDVPHKDLENVIDGKKSIYEVIAMGKKMYKRALKKKKNEAIK